MQQVDETDVDAALLELYRDAAEELTMRRLQALPLTDSSSETGRRRSRGEQIVARAIEAMGGQQRLQAVHDKRIKLERWDDSDGRWVPSGTRYHLRGERYREGESTGVMRGYDGRVSWFYRFGLLLPARDESYKAERWDFLSNYRGDGVVVEYEGSQTIRLKTYNLVTVIDTKYGRRHLAYFDAQSGLLESEYEEADTTHYREYRESSGVLTPFLVWKQNRGITRYRWHTELDVGLVADWFDVPAPVTWEPDVVRLVMFQHASVPAAGPTALKLRLEALTQKRLANGQLPMDMQSVHLLSQFLGRKLDLAGVLASGDQGSWELLWRVESFHIVGGIAGMPPVATLQMTITVRHPSDGRHWHRLLEHRWQVENSAINDKTADVLTFRVIETASAGIQQLSDDLIQ